MPDPPMVLTADEFEEIQNAITATEGMGTQIRTLLGEHGDDTTHGVNWEVEAAVEKVLAERAEFVAENGMQAMGPLMGVVMAELGGGADGKVVSAVLKEHLERLS